MMVHIVKDTEQHLDYELMMKKTEAHHMKSTSSALCHAAVTTANNLRARCIITPTVSGVTARVVSKFKPRMDIIGVTPNEAALRRMQLYWGIIPLKSIPFSSTEDVNRSGMRKADGGSGRYRGIDCRDSGGERDRRAGRGK